MKTLVSVLFFCLAFSFIVTGQNTPKEKLNNAIYQEEVNGELEKAMQLYADLVANYPDERAVVAEALYRMGLTNEKLGTQKAKEYYEKVVSGYADQPEMVKLAQARLNRILKDNDTHVADSWLEKTKKEGKGIYAVNFYDKNSNITVTGGLELMDANLSPDGMKLAGIDISIGQNVALFDLQTQKSTLFTNYKWMDENSGITAFPLWSPDGKEIAYAYVDNNGYNIKVSTLDGKTHTLLKEEPIDEQNPEFNKVIPRQWSKDGSTLLTFKHDIDGYLSFGLVSARGGDYRKLYKTQWKGSKFLSVLPNGSASLSPDGKFIVFADGPADNMDLYIMNTDDGKPALLSAHPNNEFDPLWSPDGKYIVFIRETDDDSFLYALKVEDGKAIGVPIMLKEGMQNIRLSDWGENGITYNLHLRLHDIFIMSLDPETGQPDGNPEPLQYAQTGSNIAPVWSHDGKYLAFVTYGKEYKLVLLPSDGGSPRIYTIDAPGIDEFRFYDMDWLPDNSGICFSVKSPEGAHNVYRFNLESEKWQRFQLPEGTGMFIAWGPDENTIIYSHNGPLEEKPGLFKYNVITKESEQIYSPEPGKEMYAFQTKKFSRDRKKMFCTMYTPDGSKIILLDFNTGENKVIEKSFGIGTFSPDGERIAAFVKGGTVIFSESGEILTQLNMKNYFQGSLPNSIDWSPDGQKLVINTLNEVAQTLLMRNVLN